MPLCQTACACISPRTRHAGSPRAKPVCNLRQCPARFRCWRCVQHASQRTSISQTRYREKYINGICALQAAALGCRSKDAHAVMQRAGHRAAGLQTCSAVPMMCHSNRQQPTGNQDYGYVTCTCGQLIMARHCHFPCIFVCMALACHAHKKTRQKAMPAAVHAAGQQHGRNGNASTCRCAKRLELRDGGRACQVPYVCLSPPNKRANPQA